MDKEKTIIQNIKHNHGMAIGNVEGDVKIDKRKTVSTPMLREVVSSFWFVRKKLAIVVMFSILFVSLIFIFSGVFWIEQSWAVDNIIKGLFVCTFTLVYYFTFKANVKEGLGLKQGFKGFWLTLDLLFLGIVFWVLV